MKNAIHLTLEELDNRINHFENRLLDFTNSEDQVEFIKDMLRELKNARASKASHTF